jgi:hypothetical protein
MIIGTESGKRSAHAVAKPDRVLNVFSALTAAASAQGWCGFIDAENAPVRCGYSTLVECTLAIGEKSKAAYCIADPLLSRATRQSQPLELNLRLFIWGRGQMSWALYLCSI